MVGNHNSHAVGYVSGKEESEKQQDIIPHPKPEVRTKVSSWMDGLECDWLSSGYDNRLATTCRGSPSNR
jgi:hypothetical protein